MLSPKVSYEGGSTEHGIRDKCEPGSMDYMDFTQESAPTRRVHGFTDKCEESTECKGLLVRGQLH